MRLKKIMWLGYCGQKGEERKTSWVVWDKMYRPKKDGGLGFRIMQTSDEALAKQGWRILNNSESLMAKVLKGKYFPKTSCLEEKENVPGS